MALTAITGQQGGAREGSGSRFADDPRNEAYLQLAKAKAKRETFRADAEELLFRQKAGELIPIVEHERALAGAFKKLALALETLPDVLERDAGLSGDEIEIVTKVIDDIREKIYAALIKND